jgi:N-acetyl-gamma-glutamyl-phosphate reductase
VEISLLTSNQYSGKCLSALDGHLVGMDLPQLSEHTSILESIESLDVVFMALPHVISMEWVKRLRPFKALIIDLSGDYRLDAQAYHQWYHTEHCDLDGLNEAHYGLAEIFEQPKGTLLVSNPGCYPTASLLALAPLVAGDVIDLNEIVIDAKSGVSGAGRSATIGSLYCETNETIKPYGVGTHRHTPEIERHLSRLVSKNITLQFTPHLVPMQKGILVSCYTKLVKPITKEEIHALYKKYYHDKPFIRVIEGMPETRWVIGTNKADIGLHLDERTGRLMVFCVIDNTIKGAAGQAIQNMNSALDFPQTLGLL